MQWMDAFSQTTISRSLVDKFRKVTIDIKFFLTDMWEDWKKIRFFSSDATIIIWDGKHYFNRIKTYAIHAIMK